jgi:hypothetical protein
VDVHSGVVRPPAVVGGDLLVEDDDDYDCDAEAVRDENADQDARAVGLDHSSWEEDSYGYVQVVPVVAVGAVVAPFDYDSDEDLYHDEDLFQGERVVVGTETYAHPFDA